MNTKYLNLQRNLRKNMPQPERKLWYRIRNKQLGIRFRRQYVIELPHPSSPSLEGEEQVGGKTVRILDFYAPSINLGIEIDGDSHFVSLEKRQREYVKDEELFKKYKITILRFLNTEIMENTEGVLSIILGLEPLTGSS